MQKAGIAGFFIACITRLKNKRLRLTHYHAFRYLCRFAYSQHLAIKIQHAFGLGFCSPMRADVTSPRCAQSLAYIRIIQQFISLVGKNTFITRRD